MQSADRTARRAALAARLAQGPLPARLWLAVIVGFGLAACAEPSPQVQVATADASQGATDDPNAGDQGAAGESAKAATAEPEQIAADTTSSDDAGSSADAADQASPPSAAAEDSAPMAADQSSQPSPASAPAEPPPPSADATASPAPEPTPTADPQPAPDSAASAAPPTPEADAPQTATAPAVEPSAASSGTSAGSAGPPGSGLATGRPYVVIRFTESTVDYERALAEAVKRAVARKPNLAFDLVAVTPPAGSADELADLTAKAQAEAAAVMKSLNALGIGPERVSMMTWTGQPTDVNEIRLYIR